jgi:mevalonyl-CoA ligase
MATQDPATRITSSSPPDTVSALSFVSGTTTPALWNKALSELIEEQATRYKNSSAVVFPWQGVRLSYSDLSTRSKVLARALLSCGLQRGDRVAIMAGNCVEYIEALLAAALIGCPYVVLNNTYSPQELINAVSLTCEYTSLVMRLY